MGNQANRDTIRAYMREHSVNYTTAKRALASSATASTGDGVVAGRSGASIAGDRMADGAGSRMLPIGSSSGWWPVSIDAEALTLISGDAGCGKTYWVSRIVRAALMRGDEVVVAAAHPSEYDWLPEGVRLPERSPEPSEGGSLTAALRLLEEVVQEVEPRQHSRLWVVVDGLTARDSQDADVGVQDQIERLLGKSVPLARSMGVSFVVAANPRAWSETSVSQWSGLWDNTVVLRHRYPGEAAHLCGDEVARRARDLARGEALLVTAETPDGTKMKGPSLSRPPREEMQRYVESAAFDEGQFAHFCYATAFGPQVNDPDFEIEVEDGTVGTEGSKFQPINQRFWDDTEIVDVRSCADGVVDPWRVTGNIAEGEALAMTMLETLVGQGNWYECRVPIKQAMRELRLDYEDRRAAAVKEGRSPEEVSLPTLWMVVQRISDRAREAAADETADWHTKDLTEASADIVESLVRLPHSRLAFAENPERHHPLNKHRTAFLFPQAFNDSNPPRLSPSKRMAGTIMYVLRHHAGCRWPLSVKPNDDQP